MSSILDALKKLEKEKVHRDEVSTAIASDILRSGSKTKVPQWRLPLALFVLVFIASLLTIFMIREPTTLATVQTGNPSPAIKLEPVAPVTVPPVVVPAKSLPSDLPLLSGIVFQQKKDARMAILNDLPVMEGTVIAGYTLQEIFPDYVVLTYKGQSFSLTLNP